MMPHPNQTLADERTVLTAEADLIGRARARDEGAIRAIIKANNQRLYRLARGILRDDAEAEDVVQETYIRLFTHLEDFRGDSSLTTWLSRIAINEALGRLRKRRATTVVDVEAQLSAQIIPFPQSSDINDPEKTMASVRSSVSSSARSMSCRIHSGWCSSRGSWKA